MRANQAILAAFLAVSTAAFGVEGVAFITNLKGDVAVDGAARPLLLSELARGQKITVGRDSQACVMFISTGREYFLRGPAEYQVGPVQIMGSVAMPPVARDTEWRTSDKVLVRVAQTSSASVRMRSLAAAKTQVSPLIFPTEGAIASLQPVFRWKAPEPQRSVRFSLFVPGEEKPLVEAHAAGGSYRLGAVKLRPQTEYAWSVSVGDSEIGSGRFRTLPSDALQQLEERRPPDKAEFSDRVLYAVMLDEHGARQEAREWWARLATERPDLPELASLAR